MLIAEDHADVLNPKTWVQHPQPVFERNDAAGVFGPGHHGFFKSPDGKEDWIVYHAKTSSAYTYSGRTTRAQPFRWTPGGLPDFGSPLPLNTEVPVRLLRIDGHRFSRKIEDRKNEAICDSGSEAASAV
jgi:GH43 family beta-xylosidase